MNNPHGYKIYMVDGEPYYPSGKFDQDMRIMGEMLHASSVYASVAVGLSVISLVCAVIAILL